MQISTPRRQADLRIRAPTLLAQLAQVAQIARFARFALDLYSHLVLVSQGFDLTNGAARHTRWQQCLGLTHESLSYDLHLCNKSGRQPRAFIRALIPMGVYFLM